MASAPPDPTAGKSIPDLRRLTPGPSFDTVRRVLQGDSDAAAALLAAAHLDFTLQTAITDLFIGSALDKNDRLFGGGAPLQSTEAKMHLCYGLGIIGPATRDDITSICAIRNLFAHTPIPLDFKVEAIKNKCTAMKAIEAYQAAGIYKISDLPFSKTDARVAFVNTCLGISLMISIIRKIQPDGTLKISLSFRQPDLP